MLSLAVAHPLRLRIARLPDALQCTYGRSIGIREPPGVVACASKRVDVARDAVKYGFACVDAAFICLCDGQIAQIRQQRD